MRMWAVIAVGSRSKSGKLWIKRAGYRGGPFPDKPRAPTVECEIRAGPHFPEKTKAKWHPALEGQDSTLTPECAEPCYAP